MHQGLPIVDLEGCPQVVAEFFANLGDQPVIVARGGHAMCVIRPLLPAQDASRPAGEVLADVAGAWQDIPDETLDAIAIGSRP